MATPLLERALAKLDALPPDQQDAIAALVLQELESEERWNEQFAESQDLLEAMADEALAEDERGETTALDDLLK